MPRRPFILHPLLFALYPGLALLAHNRTQLDPAESLRALALSIAGAGLVWLMASWLARSTSVGALLTSLAVVLFFTYGHVYYLVRGLPWLSFSLGRHRFLLLAWLIVLALGTWAAFRVRRPQAVHAALNWGAVGALLLPVIQLGAPILLTNLGGIPEPVEAQPVATTSGTTRPDIYFVVLDAYAREDVLREVFGYENAGFLDSLRQAGFYVADGSHSNYAQTSLSLSSVLNLDYVEGFLPAGAPRADPLAPLFKAIADSRLQSTLESLGYTTIAFASGFRGTELREAGLYLTPGDQALQAMGALGGINAFEGMLIQTSAGLLVTTALGQLPETLRRDLQMPYRAHRARILFALDELPEVTALPGPKFVFVHIVSPHPPFVFGPNGEPVENTDAYTLRNGVFLGSRQTYVERYRDQVVYLNGRVESLLPALISGSPSPVVIILSDHGPDASSVGGEPSAVAYLDERLSNLIAVRMGDCPDDELYSSLTPVNIFRIVLNACFDAGLELLPDRVFLSAYDDPYQLIEITDDLRPREGP